MWSAFICLFALQKWELVSIIYILYIKTRFTVNLDFRVDLSKYTSVYVNSTLKKKFRNDYSFFKASLTPKGRGGDNAPPPDFKTSLFRKTSPLTYPENSWLFLKCSRSYLQRFWVDKFPWRVPKSLGCPKTSKYDQITWLYVLIKTLNQKISGEKSLYISQWKWFKKKIWNQSQKNFGLKKAYFFWSP